MDYDYDLNGNRRQVIDDGQTTSYTYETSSNRIDFATDWSYGIDANGNTIEKLAADGTGFTYSYNAHNRLIRVDENTAASGNVRLADYVYNGLGQRVQKDNGTSVTQYYYGLQGQLLTESSGQSGREYYYLNGQPIATLHIDNSSPPPPSNAVTTLRIKNAVGEFLQIGEVIAIDAVSGQDEVQGVRLHEAFLRQ